jgi:hypothetical protein
VPTDRAGVFDKGYCLGLVEGLGYKLNAAVGACMPPEIIGWQMLRVVVRYIEDRPSLFAEGVAMAGHNS